jgi:D-tyrosyl-tRNA(Tyr) deacylase
MRALLQRVTEAHVEVAGEIVGQISLGWLIFLGVNRSDDLSTVEPLVDKVAGLRCFEDAQGKTNLAATDVDAEFLVVSQFTLYADTSRGRRPGFTYAAAPAQAEPLIEAFNTALRARGFRVESGRFGAQMAVSLVNDGPFTIWLDTAAS